MLLLSLAFAHPIEIRYAVPTVARFDGDRGRCHKALTMDFKTSNTAVEEGSFYSSCETEFGRTKFCIQLLEGAEWPDKWPTMTCEGEEHILTFKPVPGFDPFDDIEDGVDLLGGLNHLWGDFEAKGWPQTAGSIEENREGYCTIDDERLVVWIPRPLRRNHTCILYTPEGEKRIEVRTVRRME